MRDLQPMIGCMTCVYEIMNGTRPLTLPMIRRLHAAQVVGSGRLVSRDHIVFASSSINRNSARVTSLLRCPNGRPAPGTYEFGKVDKPLSQVSECRATDLHPKKKLMKIIPI